MKSVRLLTANEQLVVFLKKELEARRWLKTMPGVQVLASQLGVSRKTVETALRVLEEEGWLINQGPGKKRLISKKVGTHKSLRIAIQTFEEFDNFLTPFQEALENQGHRSLKTSQTLQDLDFDVKKFAKTVNRYQADGWIVMAGSVGILNYLAEEKIPVFAIAGRFGDIPTICGSKPEIREALADATERLINLGHQRIVFLVRHIHRLPYPGRTVQGFIDKCQEHGIFVSDYHLPHWEENAKGFNSVLKSLFQFTPPTAIICGEANLYIAAQQFVGNMGLRVPEDISLICADSEPLFDFCVPSPAHVAYNSLKIVSHMTEWANALSLGKEHHKHHYCGAKYIEGGTVGPVPSVRR